MTIEAPSGIIPQSAAICQAIAQNLDQIGVKVTVKLDEYPIFQKNLYDFPKHQAELGDIFLMFYKAGPTAPYTISELTNTKEGWDWSHYNNPKVDALWERSGRGEFDDDKRHAILMQIEQIGRDDVPWLFLYEPQSIWAVSKRLSWTPRNDDMIHVEDLSLRSA